DAYGFGHKGEATTGGSAHGPHAADTGTDSHVYDRQFVFGLLDANPDLLCVICHPVQYGGCRSHGIGRVELTTGGHGGNGDSFVAGDERAAHFSEIPLAFERLS